MWKCVSRSLREALGCRDQPRLTCRLLDFRWPKEPSATHGDSSYNRRNNSDWSWASYRDPTDTLFSAVTCSSALALGWVLTKPFIHARKWHCDGASRCSRCIALFGDRKPFLVALAQGSEGSRHSTSTIAQGSEAPKHSSSAAEPPQITAAEPPSSPYGPLTAQEAIDEAVNELSRANDVAVAVAANLRGIELSASTSARKRRQGYRAFLEAYNSGNYAPAAYNIAQCHELGIGTQQDFAAAAHWYKIGSDLGHAGATYNLAVFHAHGWGGLSADPVMARHLLHKAAELGSPEARNALGQRSDVPSSVGDVAGSGCTVTNELETTETPNENDTQDYCSPAEFASDPEKVFQLAQSFENSNNAEYRDPYLVMDLYGFASDLGHSAAKAKHQVLKAYEAIGLLADFLWCGSIDKGLLCDTEYALIEALPRQ